MTVKRAKFVTINYPIQKNKIQKLNNSANSIMVERDKQQYFTSSTKSMIKEAQRASLNYRVFRSKETDWETINQQYSTTQDFREQYYYAYKLWVIDLGNMPEEYIPFIDVRILWRNSGGNDDFVPYSTQQTHYFEVNNTSDDGIKSVVAHASIFFNDNGAFSVAGQPPSKNSSVDAKIIVTFLYPYNLE